MLHLRNVDNIRLKSVTIIKYKQKEKNDKTMKQLKTTYIDLSEIHEEP